MSQTIEEITQRVQEAGEFIPLLTSEIKKVIVGQDYLTERLILALITNEHILLEGVPGLAKTTSVNTLAQTIQAQFKRCLLYTSPSPRDLSTSRMPSSA